jgi:hypothetical protein
MDMEQKKDYLPFISADKELEHFRGVYNSATGGWVRFKKGRGNKCFIVFEKAFDSINREALWYKMRMKGTSYNMTSYIKSKYDNDQFCVTCRKNEVTESMN